MIDLWNSRTHARCQEVDLGLDVGCSEDFWVEGSQDDKGRWVQQQRASEGRGRTSCTCMRSVLSVRTVFSTELFFAVAQTSWCLSPFAEESQRLACLPSTSNTDVPGYLMSWNDVEWRSNCPRAHLDNRCTAKPEIKPRYSQTQFKVMAAWGCDAACGSQRGTWGSRSPCLCNSLLENNHFPFLFSLFW